MRELVRSANDLVFGSASATNFCRKQDQPCGLEAGGRRGPKTCERPASGDVGCARSRPQLVALICAHHLFDQAFKKLGRGTLMMRLEGNELPEADALKASIDAFEPAALAVVTAVANRRKSILAPLMPQWNFQGLGSHPIAHSVQANPAAFETTMDTYHSELYRSDFVNPTKRSIRGGYMLDAQTAFQEDHLHNVVQTIGPASRADAFHLLNAYHVYGVKSDPGFHFDVMNRGGGTIGHALHDVLTGHTDNGRSTHLNATPCDRLV